MGLAKLIWYSKERGSAKPAGRKQARVAQAAKKGSVNKSQAVRDYLTANPSASPSEVQAALKAKGIMISTSLASAVKYRKKTHSVTGRPVGRPRGKRQGRPPAAKNNEALRIEDVLKAKKFVDRVGGVAAARKAIEILAQLS